MSSRTFVLIRNIILTAVYAWLAWGFQQKGNNEAAIMGLTAIGSLWMHSARNPKSPSSGLSVLVPMTCALTLLSACEFQGGTVRFGAPAPIIMQPGPVERLRAEYRAQAGLLADSIEFTAAAAPSFTSGRGGIYLLNTDGLLHTVDVAGLDLKLHAAQSYRTSASCAGLAAPVNGDVCYDTGLTAFRYYAAGWTTAPTNDALLMHLAGTETVTGNKTFSGTLTASSTATFSGSLILPQTAAPAQTAEGSIVWDTNDDLLTVGDGAARKTMCDLTTAQTLTNKTLTSPTLGGTVAGTYTIGGVPTIGVNTAATSGITLTVGANVLIGSVSDKLNAAMLAIASQATGDLLVADSASTFARKAKGTDGQQLAMVSGAVTWATVPFSTASGGGTGALGAATVYLTAPGQAASATEVYLALVSRAANSRNLYCRVGTAPGGADTVVVTARENASDQALTCTITGAATTCNDTSNSFASVAGDRLSVKAVSSAGTAADITCTFEMTVG